MANAEECDTVVEQLRIYRTNNRKRTKPEQTLDTFYVR